MLTDLEPATLPPDHWSWKKITLWLLGSLLVILAGVIAYDSKLEPYDDLVPTRTTIPDARSNGFALLKERWLQWGNQSEADRENDKSVREMEMGKIPWDDALMTKMRAGRENLANDLKEALALPDYLTPPVLLLNDPDTRGFSWLTGPVNYLTLEVAALSRAGDMAGSLSLLSDLHRLAFRHIEGSGSLISLLAGSALLSSPARATCDLLEAGKLEPDQLISLQEMWQADPPLSKSFEVALSSEAAFMRDAVDIIKNRRSEINDAFKVPFAGLLLKENQTINKAHRNFRRLRDSAFLPYSTLADADAAGWTPQEDKRPKWARALDANYTGNQLFGWGWQVIVPGMTQKTLFAPRAVRVAVAIHRWRLTHPAQWPVSLQELVPEFLTTVPLDPFNGQPLLWDQATQTIYSVGSDWDPKRMKFALDTRVWFFDAHEFPALRLVRPPMFPPATAPAGKTGRKIILSPK